MDTNSLDLAGGGCGWRHRRAAGALARGLALLAAVDRRRRDADRLAALPDHLLADIGVTRDAVRWLR